jgi:hypothetical protein
VRTGARCGRGTKNKISPTPSCPSWFHESEEGGLRMMGSDGEGGCGQPTQEEERSSRAPALRRRGGA